MSSLLRGILPAVVIGAIGILLCVTGTVRKGVIRAASEDIATSETAAARTRLSAFDFGPVIGDAVLEHTVRMSNGSSEEWRVVRAWTECNCVSLSPYTSVVKPGEELELPIRLNPAAQPEGDLSVDVYALIEPGPWILVAPTTALILRRPHLIPPLLALEVSDQDGLFAGKFELRVPFGLEGLSFNTLEAPEDTIIHEVNRTATPYGSCATLMISGRIDEQRMRRDLTVVFGVQPYEASTGERLTLPVRVNRVRELSISPRSMILDTRSSEVEASAWIKDHRGGAVPGLTWSVSPEGSVSCTYEPRTGQLTVRLPASEAASVSECTVHVTSVDGKQADLPVKMLRKDL